MLCEGSPLFFYTRMGPVTKMGLSQGARRLTYCPAGKPAGKPTAPRGQTRGQTAGPPRANRRASPIAPHFDN